MRMIRDYLQNKIRSIMINNFEKTKEGRNLKKYKNIHEGESCFFIGNGPSLKSEDLDKISQLGIPTFAFNRIYYIFDDTKWRPTYYISQDEKILTGCQNVINDLDIKHKFIPINMKWYFNIHIKDAEEYYLKGTENLNFWFSKDISHSVCWASTVMYTAAQFAAYMGFKKIYLIGVDHHFHISRDRNGNITVDNSVKDYFTDKYNEDRDNLFIPSTDISTDTYYAMKKYCDELNIQVFNATRGGKLEVFKRINIDKFIEESLNE